MHSAADTAERLDRLALDLAILLGFLGGLLAGGLAVLALTGGR